MAAKMVLKYREDQWSPENPEGKKQYDRDFLLQFQLQTYPLSRKPMNLPNMIVIKDKDRIQRLPEINTSAQLPSPPAQVRAFDPFIPTYARENFQRLPDEVESIRLGPGGRGLSSCGRGRGTKAPDDVFKTAPTNRYSLAEPLSNPPYEGGRGSQRYESRGRMDKPKENTKRLNDQLVELAEPVFDGPELDKEEMEIRTMNHLDIPDKSTDDSLAKAYPVVTLRTFLSNVTMDPGLFEREIQPLTRTLNKTVEDDETMKVIVNIIFDESVRLSNLPYSGARLCKALSNDLDVSPDRLHFRSVLLTRCDQEFQRRDFFAQAADGGKYLRGFAMFFAELFSQLEFQEQKITDLGDRLANLIKTILYYDSPDNLKCACQLLKLVGADLEAYERQKSINNGTSPDMDSIMVTLKKFATKSDYENPIKERINGVINLRDSAWGRSLHTENSGNETLPPTAKPDKVENIRLRPGRRGRSGRGSRRRH